METIHYPGTNLAAGSLEQFPFGVESLPGRESVAETARKMILSASGWRAVFAESGDGEDKAPGISLAHAVIVSTAASVFADYAGKGEIIIGTDTRPTGTAIAGVMIRTFLSMGCPVRYISAAAAPEIMAYAKFAGVRGFVYISASHNPIGYNGIKFGLASGGVLSGEDSSLLIKEFWRRMGESSLVEKAAAAINGASSEGLAGVLGGVSRYKEEAYRTYAAFAREVVSGIAENAAGLDGGSSPPMASQGRFFSALGEGLAARPLGIVADFNGSARTISIDREFLSGLGISFRAINDKPGGIVHRIVPEGDSLDSCRLALEALHAEDPSFILGYACDCDGDRGNIVYWDERQKAARGLEAQEVFALACVAELAQMVWNGSLRYDKYGNSTSRAAVAVNGPTSLRIDRIAQAFDVPVFRAETGEANVVALAQRLRGDGYQVRILGEGSAGGNITHPSAVRDPVATVMALVKLLILRSSPDGKGLFEIWRELSNQAEAYRGDFELGDIISSLPAFTTTASYSPDALLKIKSADHGALKARYQKIFLNEWEEKKEKLLERHGITEWEASAFIGSREIRGLADFGEAGKGGLKILFKTAEGRVPACIWMRGSGTEPVFRVMADAEGSDTRLEKTLIEWQRHMVEEADKGE